MAGGSFGFHDIKGYTWIIQDPYQRATRLYVKSCLTMAHIAYSKWYIVYRRYMVYSTWYTGYNTRDLTNNDFWYLPHIGPWNQNV